ncbi:hypothetical protein BO78DRAFT_139587 [Aspergillus sclerotiicarbonarius CBS 121057]|uniref:Zn(2)-C6 fungal-type domain-containing protein n=1 Tax=Aspergillus sclerotiicarbonarius (strain CBS 121057 / IBT 28362) TaxID=1448318 RepID=A0A319E6J4_ASPSB|nr:hypothetical protein BO78DRAFT_139587 [Aspergillus sclerotiicarbonarius CBS 121057]
MVGTSASMCPRCQGDRTHKDRLDASLISTSSSTTIFTGDRQRNSQNISSTSIFHLPPYLIFIFSHTCVYRKRLWCAMASIACRPAADDPRRPDEPGHSRKPTDKIFRRSRSGCFTCRLRRKKCDENRPACTTCTNLGLKCNYQPPRWWGTNEQRLLQRDRIKGRIRQTKIMEKEGNLQKYRDQITALVKKAQETTLSGTPPPESMEQSSVLDQPLPTPVSPSPNQSEAQQGAGSMDVDLFPTQASSTLCTPEPESVPQLSIQSPPQTPTFNCLALPTYSGPGPSQAPPPTPRLPFRTLTRQVSDAPQPTSQQFFGSLDGGCPVGTDNQRHLLESVRNLVSVGDSSRLLLDHFIDNVLRTVFPILEVRPAPHLHISEILSLMQNNRAYLRCCLSVAAIHLKNSWSLDDQMDHAIMEHRYAAISRLLDRGSDQIQNLNATLGLVFYHSFVATSDDHLSDIPWNHHFKGVSNLVKKLDCSPSPLNVALIAWIDIIGATMLGTTPQFSHTHRQRHTTGIRSGLQHVMGCDDRIMYLISEIACLEALWIEGSIKEKDLYQHVCVLNEQINWTEATDLVVVNPYQPNGAVNPDKLAVIVTALFRLAARLYVHSILPTFDSHDATVMSWITRMCEILQYIPAGPMGFDRCLAWPLFIAGLYSVPSSQFRRTLTERVAALGFLGKFGSIGRMYRVLKEVWRVADETGAVPGSGTKPPKVTPVDGETDKLPGQQQEKERSQEENVQEPEKRYIHWREIMRSKNWEYLLM